MLVLVFVKEYSSFIRIEYFRRLTPLDPKDSFWLTPSCWSLVNFFVKSWLVIRTSTLVAAWPRFFLVLLFEGLVDAPYDSMTETTFAKAVELLYCVARALAAIFRRWPDCFR